MSERGKSVDNNGNKISLNNLMFQMLSKNTEVMTELCKALEGMDDVLRELSKKSDKAEFHRMFETSEAKAVKIILIVILVISFSTFIALALGGEVGWLIDVMIKLIPGL